MCNAAMVREFFLHLRTLMLFFGGVTVFVAFVALAADGYFEADWRFVYEFFTRDAEGFKNYTLFQTLDAKLNSTDGGDQGNTTIDGTTYFFNLTRSIPPGSMHNSSALFFVAPNVPGLAVVLVGAFGVAQIIFTIREISSNCHIVGRSGAMAARIIFFTHGQGLLQLLMQYGFYALVAFHPTVPLWKSFYMVFVMVCVLVIKNLYPLALKCCCRQMNQQITEIELVLLMPHGILSFFAIMQVPIVIAKLGGTYLAAWATALIPTWMTLLINTGGWIAFFCVFLRQMAEDQGPFGMLLSTLFVSLLYNCSVASSLILLCFNDNPDYFGQSEWPYPWWRVVLPILVAYALMIVLQLCQLLAFVGDSIRVACKRCEDFSSKQQKEVTEHVRRAEQGAALVGHDPNGAGTGSGGGGDDVASVELQVGDNGAQQANLTFVSTLARHLAPGPGQRITEQLLLEQLRSLQQLLTQHTVLVTSSNRLLIVQRFENYHNSCEEAEWSELVASRYAQLLRTFTKANVILNKFPALKNMRNLDMTRKPPLPVE